MRKLLFCLLSVFLFTPLWAQSAGDIGARVTARLQEQKSPLYTFVQQELQNYYGRTDFSDPQRSKGWYRVDDFLKWLNKNAARLENTQMNAVGKQITLKQIYANPKAWDFRPLQLAFWVYLGGRYIADVYQVKADFSLLKISYCDGGACAFGGTGVIFINPEDKDSLPSAVNLGMHETTHLLTYLMHGSSEPLTELATFYSQYNYGLPVKAADATNFGDAVRDIRLTYAVRPDFDLHYEYNYFVAGILLNSHIKPQDVLAFSKTEDFNPDISLWQTVLNLLAADKKQFFLRPGRRFGGTTMSEESALDFVQKLGFSEQDMQKWSSTPDKEFFLGVFDKDKLSIVSQFWMPKKTPLFVKKHNDYFSFQAGFTPVTKNQYLEAAFGPYAKSKRLKEFYDRLLKNLPPEVTASARQHWPALTADTFLSSPAAREVRTKFAKPYAKPLKEAVIRSLAEAGAPPPPPLPAGYL